MWCDWRLHVAIACCIGALQIAEAYANEVARISVAEFKSEIASGKLQQLVQGVKGKEPPKPILVMAHIGSAMLRYNAKPNRFGKADGTADNRLHRRSTALRSFGHSQVSKEFCLRLNSISEAREALNALLEEIEQARHSPQHS